MWTWSGDLGPSDSPDLAIVAGFGAKLPVSESGALRLDLGAMRSLALYAPHGYIPVASLSYLRDLSEMWTFSASVGYPVLLGIGMVIHPRLGDHVTTHISLGTSTVFSAGLGLGVDFVGTDEPTEK
jgi:hypothetical protein